MRTSSPVSSATSRSAVSSMVSAPCGVPLGRVHVRPTRSRRRLPTTNCGRPFSYRTTMPPAEVAVLVLRRATAPRRRWDGDPTRTDRTEPNASSPTAGPGGRGRLSVSVVGRASPTADADTGRHPSRGARSGRWPPPRTTSARRGRGDAHGHGSTGARNALPVGPRTSRRCCGPWAAMVLGQSCLASAALSDSRMAEAVSGASAPRSRARSISRCAAAT